MRKISDSLICFLFLRQIAQNRLLGEQRRRAARVPEDHRLARRNPPLAHVADQPRERLAGVNRVGQKPLGSRQKADRLVGRFVRLLIPRLEIAALNSLILQQYPNFEGHGYISNEQLDFVAKQMGWDNSENQTSIRIVMMHHHYLPTCYTEAVEATRASSTVYDADRLMNWLVKYNVKLLLHGHKHKSFISQIDYPRQPEGNITIDNMHHIIVSAMGGTGASGVQNKFATICFEGNDVVIDFYNIYSNESEKDHRCQTIRLPL